MTFLKKWAYIREVHFWDFHKILLSRFFNTSNTTFFHNSFSDGEGYLHTFLAAFFPGVWGDFHMLLLLKVTVRYRPIFLTVERNTSARVYLRRKYCSNITVYNKERNDFCFDLCVTESDAVQSIDPVTRPKIDLNYPVRTVTRFSTHPNSKNEKWIYQHTAHKIHYCIIILFE